MSGLLQRLFTYRERPERSPLEDFLSEALADVLQRMPAHLGREFVGLMLGGGLEVEESVGKLWPDVAEARWLTQKIIPGGRLDLLLEIAGKPALIIESKIGAGFQEHVEGREPDGGEPGHQLKTYGRWIGSVAAPDWGGALALLTHWTPAPADFLAQPQLYCCGRTGVARWADLSRWLRRLPRDARSDPAGWIVLAAELASFLKERNMDSELATSQDLAALQIYVASADRVRNSVEQAWESARDLWRPVCIQTENPLEISTEYGCAWKWRYLSRSDLKKSYVAAGIRWPAIADHPDYADGGEPHLFIELGSDEDQSPISVLALPEPWGGSGDSRIAKRTLRDLPLDPDLFQSDAQTWIKARLSEVVGLLR